MADHQHGDRQWNRLRRFPLGRADVIRSLSLLQTSDAITVDLENIEEVDHASLEIVVSRAARRHQVSRLLHQLPFGSRRNELLLGPGTGISTHGAILLAFHVPLLLDVESLAAPLDLTDERAGYALYEARRVLSAISLEPCESYRSKLGRFRDPGLSRGELADLAHHVAGCEQCESTLNAFRSVDETIHSAWHSAPDTLPDLVTGSRSLLQGQSVVLWTPIAAIVLFAIVALVSISLGAGGSSRSFPLAAASGDDVHRGWLIMSSEREVFAIDLQRGERQLILDNPNHDWWNPWIVSPDGQLVVRWEERTAIGDQVGAIRAFDMNGDLRYLHRWQSPRSRVFSGWLDDRTVLFLERGAVQRAGVTADVPEAAMAAILSANLETGEEREIYRGPVDKVVPSPDGRHVALVRSSASPGPGRTVDVRPFHEDGIGDPIVTVEDRFLSWTSRIVWSPDSRSVFLSLIAREEVQAYQARAGAPVPGQFEIEKVGVASISIDGDLVEHTDDLAGWAVVQAVSHDNASLALVVNQRGDQNAGWHYAIYDLERGRLSIGDLGPPGNSWWNTEIVWMPQSGNWLVQQREPFAGGEDNDGGFLEALVFRSLDSGDPANPQAVFRDPLSIGSTGGRGVALLRWVSNDEMNGHRAIEYAAPRPSTPRQIGHVGSARQIIAGTAIAPTGRHILLREFDRDDNPRPTLMHLQAWAGTIPTTPVADEFSWLPREAVAIGLRNETASGDDGTSLVFLSTDRGNPLHEHAIDPARISESSGVWYRRPEISPDGRYMTFFVHDESANTLTLWVEPWGHGAKPVDEWAFPDNARIDQSIASAWVRHDTFVYAAVTAWERGYPQRLSLMRATFEHAGEIDIVELSEFSGRGRDRGVDVREIAVNRDQSRVAVRIRHFTGSDPDDTTDSIHVSLSSDLSERIEIHRSGQGEGLLWTPDGAWLIAGIDQRIALFDYTGRRLTYITDTPSALPVLVGDSDIWYQETSDAGRIMRFSLYD